MEKKRHQDMLRVRAIVRQSWQSFARDYGYCTALDEIIYRIPKRRFEQIGIRSYYTVKMIRYLEAIIARKGGNYRFSENILLKLPMIIELVLCKQYYDNLNFDGKQDAWNHKAIHDNVIASNILRQTIDRFIDKTFEKEEKKIIQKRIKTIFLKVDIGQAMERNWNHFSGSKELSEEAFSDCKYKGKIQELEYLEPIVSFMKRWVHKDLHQQVDVYLNRIYLTCASLFIDLTKLLLDLADLHGDEKEKVLQFATPYGVMRQIVNDCKDSIPAALNFATATKSKSDGFSDLRNRILTAPILFHLSQEDSTRVKQYLASNQQGLNQEKKTEFFDEMMQSGAIFKAMKIGKLFRARAESYLDLDNPASSYLLDSCKIADFNKYYFIYHKYEGGSLLKKYRKEQLSFRRESSSLVRSFASNETLDSSQKVSCQVHLDKAQIQNNNDFLNKVPV